jgi:PAS domain S-box-containing protein
MTVSDPTPTALLENSDERQISLAKVTGQRFEELRKSLDTSSNKLIAQMLDTYHSHQQEITELSQQLQLYRERELKAFSIGDAISDGIYATDSAGKILEVNRVFCELSGVKRETVLGKNVRELETGDFISKPICQVVIEKGKKDSGMCDMKKTGKRVLAIGNPFFDDQGSITQVLVVMRDITEINKLSEKLEETERINDRYLSELTYFRSKNIESSRSIGQSPGMVRIRELANQLSDVDSTILITGETGVGKEVIAELFYRTSIRRNGPYVKINCAAMPESLIESELFGYEPGAYTGARTKGKPGVFELANKGTILLDEVGDMPMSLQPKLLRVLQEKELTRIGGTQSTQLDVRVIATTNQDLNELIKAGRFRKDLFYRLNVIPVIVPPLRSRKEDLPLLISTFLKQFETKGNQKTNLTPSLLEAFQSNEYPGNVRELKNIIERLVVTGNGKEITIEAVHKIVGLTRNSPLVSDILGDMSLKKAVKQLEKQILTQALAQYGSTYKVAKILGISQPTVVRKAHALGITK